MKSNLIFNILTLATVIVGINFNVAIDKATASTKNCFSGFVPPADGQLYDNRGNNSSINVREKPTAKSRIIHVGSHKTPVEILKQVTGSDGYCWFQVKVYRKKLIGWVRGDLLDIYPMDDIPKGL